VEESRSSQGTITRGWLPVPFSSVVVSRSSQGTTTRAGYLSTFPLWKRVGPVRVP
jgi:hypothetical protein